MVGQQFLSEASAGQAEARSQLKWPLLLTETGKLEIKKALWRHRLRSSFLARIEVFFDCLWQNYPRIITFLAAMLGAGVLIEIAKWLFKLLP
jgi:hypothetical protein